MQGHLNVTFGPFACNTASAGSKVKAALVFWLHCGKNSGTCVTQQPEHMQLLPCHVQLGLR